VIFAVTAKGLLRFSTYTGSFTGARFIEFCRKLLADTDGPVYLVVDGHVMLARRDVHDHGLSLWVPSTRSRRETCRYSWRRPPRRSRRSGRTVAPEVGGVGPAGGC
jgi:hypothetical protein